MKRWSLVAVLGIGLVSSVLAQTQTQTQAPPAQGRGAGPAPAGGRQGGGGFVAAPARRAGDGAGPFNRMVITTVMVID